MCFVTENKILWLSCEKPKHSYNTRMSSQATESHLLNRAKNNGITLGWMEVVIIHTKQFNNSNNIEKVKKTLTLKNVKKIT